jgi:diguanylate cyclase (GGDEF)-like protein/PAS domain S-box-containing protein
MSHDGWISRMHPEDRHNVLLAYYKNIHDRQPILTEYRLQSARGDWRWILDHGVPMYKENGEFSGYIGSAIDITERKQVEAEFRIAATAFESQEAMVITDTNTVILRVNKMFTDSTGYTIEEAVGHKMSMLKSDRHDAAFYAAMWACINRTGTWQGEIWDKRKNGEIYPKWLTITAVKDSEGVVTHYVGTHIDISERKAAEDEIKHLAFYDPLTGLPNRRLLRDRLQQAMVTHSRNGVYGALLFIDLDNFKTLNDTLGHDKGDFLLQQVAKRLVDSVRESDTVARLGGDEFVIMLEELSEKATEACINAELVAAKILMDLNQPYLFDGRVHHSTPSIGATLFGDQAGNIDELLKQADIAMYQAKALGRNMLKFFDPSMQAAIIARANLEEKLYKGLREKQFLLHYQPQVNGQKRITGAEALIRWQDTAQTMVRPADFIPLAEETGLILPLGKWVLETACAQLVKWAAQPELAHLSISVNVSVRQFRQADFVGHVLETLNHTGANPEKLKLELTESLLALDVADIMQKMTALKQVGVVFALDDFGTGFSSLYYLKQLPLDQLKIDRSFVRDILIDVNDAAIAKMIIALAESMGLDVVAEGVENEAQREFLALQGCHDYQGYLFSRPVPIEQFERLLLLYLD